MQADIIQSMHDQVRAIYRAITGEDVGDGEATAEAAEDTDENVTRRFAELEAIVRSNPSVSGRIPPFTFTPPVDVIAADGEVLIEVELPGLEREAITVERHQDSLQISGIRRDGQAARGSLFHAEIPRGPFLRIIPLPFPVEAEPRVELERGVLRIHLTLAASTGREGSSSKHNEQEDGREQR